MSVTYIWNVSTLETAPSEDGLTDVVKTVHWRLAATDGVNGVDTYSTVILDSPDAANFKPFADLTEAEVVAWVESKLDIVALKAGLERRLEELANPPIVVKQGPWIV